MVDLNLTLLPHLLVLPPGAVLPPGLLDGPGEGLKLPLPHLLQEEQLQQEPEENLIICSPLRPGV